MGRVAHSATHSAVPSWGVTGEYAYVVRDGKIVRSSTETVAGGVDGGFATGLHIKLVQDAADLPGGGAGTN